MTSTTAKPRQANHDEWLTRWKSNLRRMMADDGKMATPAALTGLGSIGVSGVAVWMLMSQGTVLDQHGHELNLVRQMLLQQSNAYTQNIQQAKIDVVKLEAKVSKVETEQEVMRRRIEDSSEQIRSWVRDECRRAKQQQDAIMRILL